MNHTERCNHEFSERYEWRRSRLNPSLVVGKCIRCQRWCVLKGIKDPTFKFALDRTYYEILESDIASRKIPFIAHPAIAPAKP